MKTQIIKYLLRFKRFRNYLHSKGITKSFWFSQEEFISMSVNGEVNSIYDLPMAKEMAFTDCLEILDGISKQKHAVLLCIGTYDDIVWSKHSYKKLSDQFINFNKKVNDLFSDLTDNVILIHKGSACGKSMGEITNNKKG